MQNDPFLQPYWGIFYFTNYKEWQGQKLYTKNIDSFMSIASCFRGFLLQYCSPYIKRWAQYFNTFSSVAFYTALIQGLGRTQLENFTSILTGHFTSILTGHFTCILTGHFTNILTGNFISILTGHLIASWLDILLTF